MSTKTIIIPQIDASNQKAWEQIRVEPQNSLETALHNLVLAQEAGYKNGVAWSNGIIGTAYAWLSEHEKAFEYCFLSIEQLRSCRDKKHEAEVLYTLSLIFYFLADFDKQYTYAKQSLKVFEEIGDLSGMASAYNGMGTGLYRGEKYQEALEILEKAEDCAIQSDDQQTLARVYDGMGESCLGLERLEEALSFKSKSIEVYNKLGSLQVLTFCHEAVGNIYEQLKDYDKALDHYRQSLALKKESKFELGIAFAELKIGETLLAAEKFEEAKELLERMVEIGENLNSNEILYRSHLALSVIFDDDVTLRKHLDHLKAYYRYKEKYYAESESRKIEDFKLRGKFEQLEEEKEELVAKNEELKRTFDDVKILSSIGNEITSTLDLESIFNIIYERINSLMDAQGIFVAICDYDKDQLDVPLSIQKGVRDRVFHYSLGDAKYHLPVYSVVNDQAIHINDYPLEISKYLSVEEHVNNENVNSLILIPLKVKEIVIGVLLVQNENRNAFTDHHFHLLTNFASYLSIALDNAYLYKTMEVNIQERTAELQTTYKNSELLNKIGQELISTLNFEDVFETLYYNVNKLMDATIFGVRLLNKEAQTVEYQYEYENGERLGEISVPMTNLNNYSVLCIAKNEEIFIRDHENEYKKYVKEVMVVDGEFPYSLLFYPLRDGDEVLGCISIQCFEKFAYTNYHLSIIKTLAQYTTLALLNARRYEQMEEKVRDRTIELQEQKEIIEDTNKHLMDSIRYAKRIQDATLPDHRLIDSCLKEAFVLFKPKDIVSGDFYWLERVKNKVLFAVVDCTGHGVPGAFLSLIGHNSLNQIVNELGVVKPGEILNNLNKLLHYTLKSGVTEEHTIRDGMDLTVCCLDVENNILEFAGANNPIYIINKGKLRAIKGDKMPIQAGLGIQSHAYTNHEFQLEEGDTIYLFSDGYADQFGGSRGKKLKYKAFKEILLEIHHEKMQDQETILDNKIKDWQGELEQIDDICVMGVRV